MQCKLLYLHTICFSSFSIAQQLFAPISFSLSEENKNQNPTPPSPSYIIIFIYIKRERERSKILLLLTSKVTFPFWSSCEFVPSFFFPFSHKRKKNRSQKISSPNRERSHVLCKIDTPSAIKLPQFFTSYDRNTR